MSCTKHAAPVAGCKHCLNASTGPLGKSVREVAQERNPLSVVRDILSYVGDGEVLDEPMYAAFEALQGVLLERLAPGRERSLAMTKLDEAMLWAMATPRAKRATQIEKSWGARICDDEADPRAPYEGGRVETFVPAQAEPAPAELGEWKPAPTEADLRFAETTRAYAALPAPCAECGYHRGHAAACSVLAKERGE